MLVLQNTDVQTHPVNYLIKLGISAILLVLIFNHVETGTALAALAGVSVLWLTAAVFFQLGSNVIASFRWFLIMQRLGFTHPFRFYLRSFFKGAFFNQGLPTSIGGDGLRIYDCMQGADNRENAVSGVFIDRIVGLAGLLLLNLLALLVTRGLLPQAVYVPLLLILCGLLIALLVLLFLHRCPGPSNNRFLGFFFRLSAKLSRVYANLTDFSIQTGLSILTHLLAMCAFYCLGIGMGLDYPLTVYLALVPPVILLTILPISLAGWGIREGAMVGIFLLIGADKSRVLSFSVLYGLLALITATPGLVVFLRQKHSP